MLPQEVRQEWVGALHTGPPGMRIAGEEIISLVVLVNCYGLPYEESPDSVRGRDRFDYPLVCCVTLNDVRKHGLVDAGVFITCGLLPLVDRILSRTHAEPSEGRPGDPDHRQLLQTVRACRRLPFQRALNPRRRRRSIIVVV